MNDNKMQVLIDSKNGKVTPWRAKKVRSLKLADSLKRLGFDSKAQRVRFCGSELTFCKELHGDAMKLIGANFCRERLCPMCGWRKSLKCFYQVSQIMDKVQEEQPDLVPLFLSLTVRNCAGADLSATLDTIFQGWYQVTKHRKIRRICDGWMRALEVTYNEEDDTYHPHIHAIILVKKQYFKSADYMQTSDWVALWRKACALNYDPVCDVRKITVKRRKAVAEVAKYTVKDTDFIKECDALTDKVVETLTIGLKNRRLFALGGVMKEIAKTLKIADLAEGDLINVTDENMRADVAQVLVKYRWKMGVAQYVIDASRGVLA